MWLEIDLPRFVFVSFSEVDVAANETSKQTIVSY